MIQNKTLLNQNSDLMGQNKELISKIDKYQADSELKNEKIKQLEVEVDKARRGISSAYDFDGAKIISPRAGIIDRIEGPEVGVFANIKNYMKVVIFQRS